MAEMAEAEIMEPPESLEIIDLDELNLEDDETWLVPLEHAKGTSLNSWKKWNMSEDPEVRMKKRSLVEKLDFIAKGSPTRSVFAPGASTALTARPSMASTPLHHQHRAPSKFDTRTFTRRPSKNLTFDKEDLLLNTTYDKYDNPPVAAAASASASTSNQDDWKNHTFTRTKRFSRESSEALEDDRLSLASSDTSSSHRLNDVGDVQNLARLQEESLRQSLGLNSTFTKGSPPTTTRNSGLNTTYQKFNTSLDLNPGHHNETFNLSNSHLKHVLHKDSRRSSSQDIDLEDRLSSTSDSSMSHRLNDLGDVQNLARLQEESLRQTVMSNNHRSATVSPSSENSPSTEGGPLHESEEGSLADEAASGHGPRGHGGHISGANYAQYSSQDSLPDSPYSSQSLDSQPANGQDRIGRSMPNLNKIRGQKKMGPPASSVSGVARPSKLSYHAPGGNGPQAYGLSSRHHNSGYPGSGYQQMTSNNQVPSRGAVVSRDSSTGSNGLRQPMRYQSGIRPPASTSSRIARPNTGIPRPGASRLPAPTSSGIPKPNSNPGSRASSASGPRKSSYCY